MSSCYDDERYQNDKRVRIAAVERVVDGDTVDITIELGFDILLRKRVRLRGIDTPESRTSDSLEKVYGNISKEKLKSWCDKPIEENTYEIEMRYQESNSNDKFGRVLGEIWVFDKIWTNVNRWMCEKNYAVPYDGKNKNDVLEKHLTNRQILLARGEVDE
jgi:micrococcal nuclease